MITVHIYYYGKDGQARDFAKEMVSTGIVDAIRAKAGNLKYDYFFPMEDEESVLLIDQWINQEALDTHHHSEMMSKIIALREKYQLTMRVERYKDDQEGITDNDRRFIIE